MTLFFSLNKMKRKMAIAALPFFFVPCHALNGLSAKAWSAASGHIKTEAEVDSMESATRKSITLDEVVVKGNGSKKDIYMRSPMNAARVGKLYMEENFGGSLMQSLAKQPGVKAMSIGSGESKPVIRGLGFNRIVVAENGIKHEGQQWGDDHGLETDQYAIDAVEVIKGPAALTYGSDAIGGVINLRSDAAPKAALSGGANLFARSNNESVGTTVRLAGRRGPFWYKANATLIDYADYRVPVDSIPYYSYYIKLRDHRLRNTAGHEKDVSLMVGYEGEKWNTNLRIANVNARSGFFADAHGLEVRLSDIDYDRSKRDIDLPYHTSNHLFIASHTEWHWQAGMLECSLGWQNNRRQELSEPVSHGYMPTPPDELERSFCKHTTSARTHLRQRVGRNVLHAGVDAECQHNKRGGWGFILPDFRQTQFGVYVSDRLVLNDELILSAGVRYDHGNLRTLRYRDWYKTPTSDGDSAYMERSADLRRGFNSFTWSVGINRQQGDFALKANVGKSFRMPTAKELGMDGINYNIFRYEKGNADLRPEESYQADAGALYERGALTASLAPYLNYFPNYIYLNPTSGYREGLQLYHYTQSRVLRWGVEASLSFRFLRNFELNASGEYLRARQLSGEKKGYSLPFSTPWSSRVELRYHLPTADAEKGGFAALECVVVGRQDEVVPPEEPTPGYRLLNASAGKSFQVGKGVLHLTLRCDNLLDTKYYDHTSYYRLIGVPEPGRSWHHGTSENMHSKRHDRVIPIAPHFRKAISQE